MSVFGIGVDVVEIARIAAVMERQGDAFLNRCFLPTERAYCDRHREPARSYAARFAAKEAVAKALGTGFGAELSWADVEVLRDVRGAPSIVLHGVGALTAARLGVGRILVSLSHSEHYAVANAVALATTVPEPPRCA